MPNPPEKVVLNRDRIAALAQSYEGQMVGFLRDLVAIPAESSHEKPVIERIHREMEKVGFDEIRTDPMGNICWAHRLRQKNHYDGLAHRRGGCWRPEGMVLGSLQRQS